MQLTNKKKTQLFLGSFIRQCHENKSLVGSMMIQTSNLILQLETHHICKKIRLLLSSCRRGGMLDY